MYIHKVDKQFIYEKIKKLTCKTYIENIQEQVPHFNENKKILDIDYVYIPDIHNIYIKDVFYENIYYGDTFTQVMFLPDLENKENLDIQVNYNISDVNIFDKKYHANNINNISESINNILKN